MFSMLRLFFKKKTNPCTHPSQDQGIDVILVCDVETRKEYSFFVTDCKCGKRLHVSSGFENKFDIRKVVKSVWP